MRNRMLQSAMEYLMTYGWAILIIAVVLGALFGLGFFNAANLAPKVGPGACQVYRPYGPGTTSFINLEGTCNNELPQYVAQFNGGDIGGAYVPGSASYISVGTTGIVSGNAISSFAWVYIPSNTLGNPLNSGIGFGIYSYGLSNQGFSYCVYGSTLRLVEYGTGNNCNSPGDIIGGTISPNTWYFVGVTYQSSSEVLYVDGSPVATGAVSFSSAVASNSFIGKATTNHIDYFLGSISNVQVYNVSLTANEVAALYQEGIGGVPIRPTSLVAWWPLNGNANDYSGNQNNGAPVNIIYTSSWTSGYSAP